MNNSIAYALPLLFLACGCAPYRFHAVAASPPALAASLEARGLDDSGLRNWMQQAAGFEPTSWPLAAWDLSELTLAAYYFSPDMDVERANAAVASAAVKTAAMKPNPAISLGPGYETAAESPYLMGFDFSLPIETAGKRVYRMAEAEHLSAASRIQIAETAWKVRSRVRAALTNLIFARQAAEWLREQEVLETKYVDLLEARFRAGEIPLPEVTTARIELSNLRQAHTAAEGQVEADRASLAAAVGIPLSGLAGKTVSWPDADNPPAPDALPSQSIRTAAIENRLDVQRALAQYEATQSRLQLEAARQYPDIDLGPGYAYEEGAHLISLQLGSVLPLRNHNEGPIAEAEAQRKAAGAHLLATQSAVIAQTDQALAQYDAAYVVFEQARRSAAEAQQQRQTAYQWLTAGEADPLIAVSAELQAVVADRARIDALRQAQLALGVLEDALERPIAPNTAPALPQTAPR